MIQYTERTLMWVKKDEFLVWREWQVVQVKLGDSYKHLNNFKALLAYIFLRPRYFLAGSFEAALKTETIGWTKVQGPWTVIKIPKVSLVGSRAENNLQLIHSSEYSLSWILYFWRVKGNEEFLNFRILVLYDSLFSRLKFLFAALQEDTGV